MAGVNHRRTGRRFNIMKRLAMTAAHGTPLPVALGR